MPTTNNKVEIDGRVCAVVDRLTGDRSRPEATENSIPTTRIIKFLIEEVRLAWNHFHEAREIIKETNCLLVRAVRAGCQSIFVKLGKKKEQIQNATIKQITGDYAKDWEIVRNVICEDELVLDTWENAQEKQLPVARRLPERFYEAR